MQILTGLLAFLWHEIGLGQKYGDVRLVDGGSPSRGRLEVYFGEWGSVCDTTFDDVAATVVCKQLRYQNGVSLENVVPDGVGKILVSKVKCTGVESKLRYCSFTRNPNCSHRYDIGIACIKGVDGGWSNWFSWSRCGTSCGLGIQHRYRMCNKPVPNNGGKDCVGLPVTTKACLSINCSDIPYQITNGGWGTWYSWSSCSATCGDGMRHRYRKCNNPVPKNGLDCSGATISTRECKSTDCPVVTEESIDGGWSTWYNWSTCSVSCGKGVQHRYRKCNNSIPNFNGSYCLGDVVTTQQCLVKKCQARETSDPIKLKEWLSTEIFFGIVAGSFLLPIVCCACTHIIKKGFKTKDVLQVPHTSEQEYNSLRVSRSEHYDVMDYSDRKQNETDNSKTRGNNIHEQAYENVYFELNRI